MISIAVDRRFDARVRRRRAIAIVRFFRNLDRTLRVWQRRITERDNLAAMNEHQLKDIGLTRTDAWREANKPFWRD